MGKWGFDEKAGKTPHCKKPKNSGSPPSSGMRAEPVGWKKMAFQQQPLRPGTRFAQIELKRTTTAGRLEQIPLGSDPPRATRLLPFWGIPHRGNTLTLCQFWS